ncbi:hypothetical protein K443DRAFT_191428 [Laccaria amethystina LaAM-08-1]|jgi:hypothetical protein|uniref:Uncharacterized protein n=1 Tax=Laccaria amethystina LaAM-08-1 TaxID=1095629 RepID=A0A0C9X1B7_9AGAR|nr:hypothetical protein K443DRAFT_191428 [Laccaria amethystina LaAM-08-1]
MLLLRAFHSSIPLFVGEGRDHADDCAILAHIPHFYPPNNNLLAPDHPPELTLLCGPLNELRRGKWNRPNKKSKKIDSMITDECGNALLPHSHLQVEASVSLLKPHNKVSTPRVCKSRHRTLITA